MFICCPHSGCPAALRKGIFRELGVTYCRDKDLVGRVWDFQLETRHSVDWPLQWLLCDMSMHTKLLQVSTVKISCFSIALYSQCLSRTDSFQSLLVSGKSTCAVTCQEGRDGACDLPFNLSDEETEVMKRRGYLLYCRSLMTWILICTAAVYLTSSIGTL